VLPLKRSYVHGGMAVHPTQGPDRASTMAEK